MGDAAESSRRTDCSPLAEEQTAASVPKKKLQPNGRTFFGGSAAVFSSAIRLQPLFGNSAFRLALARYARRRLVSAASSSRNRGIGALSVSVAGMSVSPSCTNARVAITLASGSGTPISRM